MARWRRWASSVDSIGGTARRPARRARGGRTPYACPMTAVAALDQLQSRRCPVCGSSAEEAVIEANVEASRLGPLAFASRKPPELMHHRLVGCPVCDTLYASPAPTPAALEAAYAAAAYDSAESARFAARTYAGFLPRVLARTPA